MTRRMFAALLILLPRLRSKSRKQDHTGAWRAAWALRRNLEEMGLYDDMPENWQEVEKAIGEGCTNFTTAPSRIEVYKAKKDEWIVSTDQPHLGLLIEQRDKDKMLYRVLPMKAQPNEYGWFEKWTTRR